jgi:hypothetical protein
MAYVCVLSGISSVNIFFFFCFKCGCGDFLASAILVLVGCEGASASYHLLGNKLNASGILDAVKGVIAGYARKGNTSATFGKVRLSHL